LKSYFEILRRNISNLGVYNCNVDTYWRKLEDNIKKEFGNADYSSFFPEIK